MLVLATFNVCGMMLGCVVIALDGSTGSTGLVPVFAIMTCVAVGCFFVAARKVLQGWRQRWPHAPKETVAATSPLARSS